MWRSAPFFRGHKRQTATPDLRGRQGSNCTSSSGLLVYLLLLVSGDSETNATATTAVGDDFLAALGAIALTEAMGPEAAGVAGLKSTLRHDDVLR